MSQKCSLVVARRSLEPCWSPWTPQSRSQTTPPTEDRAHLNFTAVFSNTPKNQQCFKKLFKFDPFFVNLRLFRVQPALLHKVNLQMFVNLLFWAPSLLNCPKRGFSLALGGAFF